MIGFDFSGLTLRLAGLPPRHETHLNKAWAPFASEVGDPWLDARVAVVAGEAIRRGAHAKEMTSAVGPDGSRWTMVGGSAHVPREGPIELQIEDGSEDEVMLTVINLMHASIAWRLPAIGGALLHAAGAVVDGRAFVLVGTADAGKTTWARLAQVAGATVLSDDIVLVVRARSGFEVLGSPLRAKDFGGGMRGRWPLASILLPRHGATVAIEPAASLFVQAALIANLPYVADVPGKHAEIDAVVTALATDVPARTLVFSREDGGMSRLREMPR